MSLDNFRVRSGVAELVSTMAEWNSQLIVETIWFCHKTIWIYRVSTSW